MDGQVPEQTIAIIDPFHPSILETIRNSIPEQWSLSVAQGRESAQQVAAIAKADMAFVMAAPMPAELLQRAERLRFIQKLGAGVDRIDTKHCASRGIVVARLHAGNAIPVAEHTLMLILSAYRRLPHLDRQTRAGQWDKEQCRGMNRQLNGKTVGIVGFGAIGRRLARLLSGFEVTIIYFDPARAPAEVEAELNAHPVDLDELLSQSDVVSLHLPLLKETAGIIDAKRIARLKPDALLVNCARGGLIDETALFEALKGRRIFGAAFDAFSQEPPIGNPILELDNTVVTPHAAGATLDNFVLIAERAVANSLRFLAGEDLPATDVVVGRGSAAAA